MIVGIPEFPEPCLIIVGGIHGAGKTTIVHRLSETQNFSFLSPQTIATESKAEGRIEVMRALRCRAIESMGAERSFYFEHVMSGNFVPKLIEKARDHSYHVALIYLDVDWKIAKEREFSRRENGPTRGFESRNNSESKHYRSRENFWNRYRILADQWFLFDNSRDDFEIVASGDCCSTSNIVLEAKLEAFKSRL